MTEHPIFGKLTPLEDVMAELGLTEQVSALPEEEDEK